MKSNTSREGDTMSESAYSGNFWLICGANLLIYLSFHMLTPTFPFYIRYLGGNEATIGLVTGGYALLALLTRPLIGWVLDHVSRCIPLFVGLAIMTMLTFIYSWVSILQLAVLIRFIHALCWSSTGTSVSTNAYDIIPVLHFMQGVSYFASVATLAMSIAPPLGLWLLQIYSFDLLFAVAGGLNLAALLLMLRFRFKQQEQNEPKKGERKLQLHLSELFNRTALPASVALFLLLIPYGGITTFIALYTQSAGLGNGGLFFSFFAGTAFVSRLFCGKVAEKKNESLLVYFSVSSFALALLMILLAKSATALLLAGIFLGLATGVMVPSLQSIALSRVDANHRGSASSTYLCLSDAGIGIGGMVSGFLVVQYGYTTMFGFMFLPIVLIIFIYHFWVEQEIKTYAQ